MAEKTFGKVRLVGCSPESLERAIGAAVGQAASEHGTVSWFEVAEIRGAVAKGKVSEWQVTVDLGYRAG